MSAELSSEEKHQELLRMTSDIAAAYLANNDVKNGSVSEVISQIYDALASAQSNHMGGIEPDRTPAVPIKKSITPDYIICLEDGRKLKMLKRHLRTAYNMTPQEYRMKWGLPADYPMVAPNYAESRSAFAKKVGLGRKRK